MMTEALGLVIDPIATVVAIVASGLTFFIALLVFLCDKPLLDANLEAKQKRPPVPRRRRRLDRRVRRVPKQSLEARLQQLN